MAIHWNRRPKVHHPQESQTHPKGILVYLRTATLCTGILVSATTFAQTSHSIHGKFVPANGKIQFIMGQDSDTLSAAQTELMQDGKFPQPYGITLYTNLGNTVPKGVPWRTLGGIPKNTQNQYGNQYDPNPIQLGSGTVDFQTTIAQYFQSKTISVGLWLNGTSVQCSQQPLRALLNQNDPDLTPQIKSQYQYYVHQLGKYFKSIEKHQIMLRIGYEFDGPWNCFTPELFREAFKEIRKIINSETDNVAYVWQASGWPRPYDQNGSVLNSLGVPYGWLRDLRFNSKGVSHPLSPNDPQFGQEMLSAFYPGDDIVDWIGLSYFYGEHWENTWGQESQEVVYSPIQAHNAILKFARSHQKPVQISESAPQGYDLTLNTVKTIFNKPVRNLSDSEIWDGWYAPFFKFIADNRDVIRSVAYINANWQSQANWVCSDGSPAGSSACPNGYWGDHRLQSNPFIRDRFENEIRSGYWMIGD